jgi:hypothetical protein
LIGEIDQVVQCFRPFAGAAAKAHFGFDQTIYRARSALALSGRGMTMITTQNASDGFNTP